MIRTLAAATALSLLAFTLPVWAHDGHGQAAPDNATDAAPCPQHDGPPPPDAAAIMQGDIAISGAFSRATLPNAPVGGGFLTLTNGGDTDDTLISASAAVSAEVQLHHMAMEGDVMRMRQLKEGIPLPAGETVTLQPGGLHIMFMGLNTPLVEGETLPITLTFARAGTVTIDMPILATAADAPAQDGHHGH